MGVELGEDGVKMVEVLESETVGVLELEESSLVDARHRSESIIEA